MELSREIRTFYEAAPELDRLSTGPFQLEFERTKELLLDRLPKPPAVILDVGGGPGSYAVWLAELGYEVHLIDPVEHLVNQAKQRSANARSPIASCVVGDARELFWRGATVDAVLELGPLYHLVQYEDRLTALLEAFRVLRPNGRIFAAGISRFASILDGMSRGLLRDTTFKRIVVEDLESGVHRNDTGKLDYFTTAKFHRPEELKAEVGAAGFVDVRLFGIEGPGWILTDFDERWGDPGRREDLLLTARRLEQEPAVVGMSAHFLVTGVKGDTSSL